LQRDFAVQAIRKENRSGKRWAEVALENATLGRLTRDVMLLVYEARARWNDATAAERTHCATIYVHRDGEGRVAFHQQTPGVETSVKGPRQQALRSFGWTYRRIISGAMKVVPRLVPFTTSLDSRLRAR
jgi:hypothetical protein